MYMHSISTRRYDNIYLNKQSWHSAQPLDCPKNYKAEKYFLRVILYRNSK